MKQYLMSACLGESEYAELTERIETENRKNLQIFTAIALFFLCVMILISPVNALSRGNLAAYATAAVFVIIIRVIARTRKGTVLPLVYLFEAALLGFGIALGVVTSPTSAAGTFVALLLTVPLLFVDRPLRVILLILCADAIFIPFVFLNKPRDIWSNDLINACIYGAISMIVSSYMMRVKLESYRNEEIISKMANMDTMTGLKNRNCFETDREKHIGLHAADVFCVYVDVNGLHELNNRKGHAAGDAMLVFIAHELKAAFCQDDVYRMGGDEFLVCGTNKKEQEILMHLDLFKTAVRQAGYHVAVGVEYRCEPVSDMEEMVRQSEQKMLEDKSSFYKNTEWDRRKR
ncbi:MAG: GGDEF domain-containing protein [Eubacteriales bacterium]|nr:GGDEF domain-containing protein [Eubacteriales bacterium]